MSFSGNVKEELNKHISSSRHCQLAELAAIMSFYGVDFANIDYNGSLCMEFENEAVARKCFTLLSKTFNIKNDLDIRMQNSAKNRSSFRIFIDDSDAIKRIAQALGSDFLIQKSCCMRAYLRGAFIVAGSISNPSKSYHFEIVCHKDEQAKILTGLLSSFDIEAKMVKRKNHTVVYVKEGSLIVDILNVMEAHVALMEFENLRILKDMRNSLNRRVNCETANIQKTVTAAVKQTDDIKRVMAMPEYKSLPEGIKQIAELRLMYPDASLKELGEYCNPPVGKSGVNHRLRKLSEIAENKLK